MSLSGSIPPPQKQPDNLSTAELKPQAKKPSLIDRVLKNVFGQDSAIYSGWKARSMVAEMKRDGLYDIALECLGLADRSTRQAVQKIQEVGCEKVLQAVEASIQARKEKCQKLIQAIAGVAEPASDTLVDGFLRGETKICNEMRKKLDVAASTLGYSNDPKIKGFRSLRAINDLWQGSLDDRLLALQVINDQISARDIQVDVMRELFAQVPEADLQEAMAKHYDQYDKPLEIRIPIGKSGLAKAFFKNEKGQIEVALVLIKEGASGICKKYNFAGSVSAVKDVACLDLYFDNVEKDVSLELLHREMDFWQQQMAAKIRHIPALYSYTERNIFCENFTGGDVFDWIIAPECTPEIREEFFKKAGIVLLEYLEDIGKQNLVHRDLKPENMLLSKDKQTIVVTDFGFMARVGETRDAQGTPGYHPPEVGEPVDARSDIYSAAMTLAVIRYAVVADRWGNIGGMKKDATGEVAPALDGFDTLLQRMASRDLKDRPAIGEVLATWRGLCGQ